MIVDKPGKLTISRITTNEDKSDWIRIQLQDETHHYEFVIDVKLEEFAMAITGLGGMSCLYTKWNNYNPHPQRV